MFRTGTVVVALALAVGCTAPSSFAYESTLDVRTRGVALAPGGETGQAGMVGTTCAFDTQSAGIAEDYDFPGNTEEVQDAGWLNGEVAVTVVSEGGAHLTFPDAGWGGSTQDLPVRDVAVAARVLDTGVAILNGREACAVTWIDLEGARTTSVSPEACTGDFAADPGTGQAWVAHGDVAAVTSEGEAPIPGLSADVIAWDATAEVLYAGTVGGSELTAVEPSGAVRWAMTLPGALVALDDMGTLGAVAAMVELEDETGRVLVVDGWTGEIRDTLTTPSAAESLVVDREGRSLAAVLSNEVHFFSIGTGR